MKKVIVVCMLDSPHTARWLSLFSHQEIEFYLFASTPNRRIHPIIQSLIRRDAPTIAEYRVISPSLIPSLFHWVAKFAFRIDIRPRILASRVLKIAPDFVHAMELNHAGYLWSDSTKYLTTNRPNAIATNWGSDIYWFSRFEKHHSKIMRLLSQIERYSAECERDVVLAIELGFKGIIMPVVPNAGGFPLNDLEVKNPEIATRRIIAVKGYQSFVGRASISLAAIRACKSELRGYQVVIYSANLQTVFRAKLIKLLDGIEIQVHRKKKLSHNEMKNLFSNSAIYLGVSLSDGISTSLLEAMAFGAFPIQTNTSCANEWIVCGTSGFLVSASIDDVADKLKIALEDTDLRERASLINKKVAIDRLDNLKISQTVEAFYQ